MIHIQIAIPGRCSLMTSLGGHSTSLLLLAKKQTSCIHPNTFSWSYPSYVSHQNNRALRRAYCRQRAVSRLPDSHQHACQNCVPVKARNRIVAHAEHPPERPNGDASSQSFRLFINNSPAFQALARICLASVRLASSLLSCALILFFAGASPAIFSSSSVDRWLI